MLESSFRNCFSTKALKLAWERVNASVGPDAKDYFGINVFSSNLDTNLIDFSEKILSNEFKPSRPFKYFQPKKAGTQRTKTVLKIHDALVFQAIGNHIAELVYSDLKQAEQSVFGSVLNANVVKGVELIDEDPEDFYFFEYYVSLYNRFLESINKTLKSNKISHLLETDVTGFFDSIPHSVIIIELNKRGIADEILELLAVCLNVWSGTRDFPTIGVGIPQGPATSFLLANLILDFLDKEIIKRDIPYYRFMDDIRVYGKSESELNSHLVFIDRLLKGKSLNLNAQKTSIKKVTKKETEKEKLLDTSGITIELTRNEEIETEILEQDATQLSQLNSEANHSNGYSKLYEHALQLIELQLEKFTKTHAKISLEITPAESREFFTLSQKWRSTVKILEENKEWHPDQSMIPIWLFGVRKFYWKANIIACNLRYYKDLSLYYDLIISTFREFQSYEWVQYQILSGIGSATVFGKQFQLEILGSIPKTESPLVRLGYFLILIDSIKTDTKFFESISELIKSEENDYVKESILNSISYKHLNIPIDVLKSWFL